MCMVAAIMTAQNKLLFPSLRGWKIGTCKGHYLHTTQQVQLTYYLLCILTTKEHWSYENFI